MAGKRLDAMLLVNGGEPARERLTLIRIFEELPLSRLRGRLRFCPALYQGMAGGARGGDGGGVRAAELCAGRGVPV